jgi:predicted ribosomally synthesized peptide with SipW-like signal peptide
MNKKKTIIAAIVLLLVLIVGGAVAYFTDTKTTTNTFTIGDVKIEIQEPAWNTAQGNTPAGKDVATDMMPGETAGKDPKIHNLSTKNSAYVFMKVESPCTTAATGVELFPYTSNTNSAWYLMTDGSCSNGKVTRIYAYGSSTAMTALSADATTPALFTSLTLKADWDGTNKPTSTDVVVTGYAIQSEGLTATAPSAVWTAANFR